MRQADAAIAAMQAHTAAEVARAVAAETERLRMIVRDAAAEAVRMQLAAAIPGGSQSQRVKAKAFAAGVLHAMISLRDHLPRPETAAVAK